MKLSRTGPWPGLPPNIDPKRVMCSNCRHHSSAQAGWQWDRCLHPKADYGSVVRNDRNLTCADARKSMAQCGPEAIWFEEKLPYDPYAPFPIDSRRK